jgi:hypothetical protein
MAELSLHAMVSGRQACDRIAILSVYKARWVLGGSGISAIYREKRTVDRTVT